METEKQLVDAIRRGDRQALRRLYERYSGYALAISMRYVSEREDARDVMQESFVSILTAIDRFSYQGEGSLKSWVSTIVVHKAVDWVKSHGHFVQTGDVPDMGDDEPPDVMDVPPEVLNSMIRRLPVGCRTVLNLHVFERLPHADIARRLGIQESSSASQFSRAKRLLANMIKVYKNSQEI